MTRSLSVFLYVTDISFLLYWAVAALSLVVWPIFYLRPFVRAETAGPKDA